MRIQQSTASILSAALAVAFCLPPETWAQNQPQGSQTQSAPAAQSNAAGNQPASRQDQLQTPAQKPPSSGVTVNPSQAPLQPVTTYPDAAGNAQQQPDASNPVATTQRPQTQQPQTEPQGAATAEKVPTAGGAAAKPAGVAIAPAKQHQARSLLIKLGAVAAGAVAAGTIYALSRGTSPTPPGATSPGAVQKR